MLHVIGPWLFEACAAENDKFSEGHAEALYALCQLFTGTQAIRSQPSDHSSSEFQHVYIARFCRALCQGLKSDTLALTAAILSTTSLFTFDIRGIRALIPHFLAAISAILNEKQAITPTFHQASVSTVRRAALQVFSRFPVSLQKTHVRNRAADSHIAGVHAKPLHRNDHCATSLERAKCEPLCRPAVVASPASVEGAYS
jgi:hypothetical protein